MLLEQGPELTEVQRFGQVVVHLEALVGLGLVFFSSRRRHPRFDCDWSSDVCSSDLVWARFLAPRGLGTEEPSMLARLQSIWSCSRKRVSMAWCSCSQTPAAFQSRRRRQQVMPLP